MRFFLLPLWISLVPLGAKAQDFVSDIEDINRNLSLQEIDHYVQEKDPEGLPGDYITSIIPKEISLVCPDEEEEQKEVRYEVILVAEGGSDGSVVEEVP